MGGVITGVVCGFFCVYHHAAPAIMMTLIIIMGVFFHDVPIKCLLIDIVFITNENITGCIGVFQYEMSPNKEFSGH